MRHTLLYFLSSVCWYVYVYQITNQKLKRAKLSNDKFIQHSLPNDHVVIMLSHYNVSSQCENYAKDMDVKVHLRWEVRSDPLKHGLHLVCNAISPIGKC